MTGPRDDDPAAGFSLPPLPRQPEGVPWPTESWPRGEPDSQDPQRLQALADGLFDLPAGAGYSYALLIVQRGRLVYERYGFGANAFYLQYSWSMAKSITHALTGLLVADGRLDLHAPPAVPEWRQDGDPRAAITLDQLLTMRSGLAFNEDYVDGQVSDVIPMLTGADRHDTGAFAAAKALQHEPGSHFAYASGTTNIVCRLLRDIVGNGAGGMLDFMRARLFEPIGMRLATPRFDSSGTFIGSSFLLDTPQDFARFGYLYLRGGQWDGRQILPADWVDYARRPSHNDGVDAYGAHWWLRPDRPSWFYASGYDGQRILLVPEKDLVLVRCGRTAVEHAPPVWNALYELAELL